MTRFEVGPGVCLNLEVEGADAPIVLLHGFTGSAGSWGAFGEGLCERHTVVAVDIVGHGQSDSPVALDHYRMATAVDDIVRAVRMAGFAAADWLGYSMGGRTALQVAACRPEVVERLVLIGASPGLATEAERVARVQSDEALAGRILAEGLESFVNYWENIPLFESQKRLPAEQRAAIRAGRLAGNPVGLANSLRGMGTGAQEPLHDRLHQLRMPVLVMAGELDSRYLATGEEMVAALPNARFHAVPGAGHAAHVENPADCLAAVETFLSEQPVEGPS